jgi:hypothetical protein
MIGIAFRLWARCQQPENREDILGLAGIPRWLSFPANDDVSINPSEPANPVAGTS